MSSFAGKLGYAFALAAVSVFVLASSAQASLGVFSYWGNSSPAASEAGGEFAAGPAGIAVNDSSGDVYVVDSANHRIQQFNAAGAFIRAWGADVIAAGKPNDNGTGFEICDTTAPSPNLAADCKKGAGAGVVTGGGMNTPKGIAIDQTTGSVYVTDSEFKRVDVFTATGVWVRSWGRDVVASGPGNNGTEFEVCGPSDVCKAGTAGSTGGPFGGSAGNTAFNGHPAVVPAGAPNAGNVIVADPANRRVQEFTPAGVFVRAFGFDVEIGGVTTFEICTVAVNCKAGTAGKGLGQFSDRNPQRVAADASGAIYTSEPPNNAGTAGLRVQKFSPQPALPALLPEVFAPSVWIGAVVESSPTAIAVDPDDGHVFIAKGFKVEEGAPAAEVNESRVLEFDPAGNLLDTHMAGAGINPGSGSTPLSSFAVKTGGRPAYVTSAALAPRVYVLDQVPAPGVAPEEVTDVTNESAMLHATVSPSITPPGLRTSYHFEYSKNGFEWIRSPLADVDIGNGSAGGGAATCPTPEAASCEVSQAITGLEPNREYRVRIFAKTEFNGASVTVNLPSFITPASPPVVSTRGALWSNAPRDDAQTPSLLLKGTVNPRNDEASFYFEFVEEGVYQADKAGGGDGFGQATQTALAQAGRGINPLAVQQPVFDLNSGKTYRYRILATNSVGTVIGAERAVAPPDAGERFYELVSDGESWGSGINAGVHSIADSNERAQFSAQAFGQPKSVPSPSTTYTADRGAGGWAVRAMPPEPETANGSLSGTRFMSSAELGETLWPESTFSERLRGEVKWSISGIDGSLVPASGHLAPLARSGETALGSEYVLNGATGDLSTFVFSYVSNRGNVALLADEVPLGVVNRSNLYEISDGTLQLVNRASNPSPGTPGAIIGGACGAGLGANLNPSAPESAARAISDDGAVVYFSAIDTLSPPAGSCIESSGKRLFKRISNETTVRVSEAQCTPTPACPGDPGGNDNFKGASTDGSVVFFSSPRRLVNSDTDNTNDLYVYDATPPAGQPNLAQASLSSPAGTAAKVLGVLDVSADGSRVYFAAEGVLTAVANGQGKTAAPSQPNLYVYERDAAHPGGRVAFVGTLTTGDAPVWGGGRSFALPNSGAESDGRFLLFVSGSKLVAGDVDGTKDLYRYEDETGELLCLSCAGSGPFDVAMTTDSAVNFSFADQVQRVRSASTDMTTVVFSTREQLLGADENTAPDVYAWDEGAGIELITGGTEEFGVQESARESGISPDGRNVFFVTRAPLVASDGNEQLDLYDARVNGGFPAVRESIFCEDDQSCKGSDAGVARTEPASPATAGFKGPGNESSPRPCPKGKVRRGGKCVKPKPHKKQSKKAGKGQKKRAAHERGGNR